MERVSEQTELPKPLKGEGMDDLVLMLIQAGVSRADAQFYEKFLLEGGLIVAD